MTAPFGLNILAQYVRDRNALMAWLNAANPAACVVMDDANLTQQVKKALPVTTVIHRAYNPNDSRWWTAVNAQTWVDAHVGFAANGVVVQCLNEPVLDNAGMTWLEQVCALCPPDVALALPNFAVGNPYEGDILNGKYDRLLRLVCGTRHILALHEYFHDDPAAEQPWLCGRYAYWQRRARELGLPEPRIVITEHGRDIGGGRHDGWQDAGWSQEQYCNRLLDAQEDVYLNAVPVCVYCWGTGANNDWLSFDIQDAGTLQKMLINWNENHPIQEQPPMPNVPPPTTGGVNATLTKMPGSYVNFRIQPNSSAPDVGDAYKGDDGVYYPDAISGGWGYFRRSDGTEGWISLQNGAVAFTVDAPEPPDPEPPSGLPQWTQQEVDDLTKARDLIDAVLKGKSPTGNTFW